MYFTYCPIPLRIIVRYLAVMEEQSDLALQTSMISKTCLVNNQPLHTIKRSP